MSWRTITENDVRALMNSPEDAGARQKYLASGQTDPLPEVVSQVTADFRDAIRSHPGNTLDPDETTLPSGSIRHACVIIRHTLLGRFGLAISEGRMKEYEAATKHLERLESGKRRVSVPGATDNTPPPLPAPAVNPNPKQFRWNDQDGI